MLLMTGMVATTFPLESLSVNAATPSAAKPSTKRARPKVKSRIGCSFDRKVGTHPICEKCVPHAGGASVMKQTVPAIAVSMAAQPLIVRPSRLAGATEDARTFEGMYRAHYAAVYQYAARRLPERADDVVAEVFLVAWRRLGEVPVDALPWLYGVARRVIADLRRSARRQAAVADRVSRLREPETSFAELGDLEIACALRALPESDRELLLLVHWEDLELGRAARAVGCSRAAAATRLWRARRRLRIALGETGGEPR